MGGWDDIFFCPLPRRKEKKKKKTSVQEGSRMEPFKNEGERPSAENFHQGKQFPIHASSNWTLGIKFSCGFWLLCNVASWTLHNPHGFITDTPLQRIISVLLFFFFITIFFKIASSKGPDLFISTIANPSQGVVPNSWCIQKVRRLLDSFCQYCDVFVGIAEPTFLP